MSVARPESDTAPPTQTSVYRYYDATKLLLYVGVTNRATRRQQEHNGDKEWWPFVHHQTVEHFPSRAAALAREKELIVQYRPPFNRQHNPDYEAMREIYLAVRKARSRRGLPNLIRCQLVGRDAETGQPMLRSVEPLGCKFVVKNPGRLSARMLGSKIRFGRVTVAREHAGFLVLRLLRDDPALTGANVHIKWDTTVKPVEMGITSVAVHCYAGD